MTPNIIWRFYGTRPNATDVIAAPGILPAPNDVIDVDVADGEGEVTCIVRQRHWRRDGVVVITVQELGEVPQPEAGDNAD